MYTLEIGSMGDCGECWSAEGRGGSGAILRPPALSAVLVVLGTDMAEI